MRFNELTLISLVLHLSSIMGQSQIFSPIKVGEKVPNISLGKIVNCSNEIGTIGDLKGKFVLLDFWFKECTSCIREFPKLEKMQKKFGDKISIISVGFDFNTPGGIEKYVDKVRGTKQEIHLPVAIQSSSDSVLLKLFPAVEFPHEVWIDQNGILRAITGANAVTEDNIRDVIEGKILPFKPFVLRRLLSKNAPFLIYKGTDENKSENIYGTAICGFIDSLEPSFYNGMGNLDTFVTRLVAVNSTIYNLYDCAYAKDFISSFANYKRIIVETAFPFYGKPNNVYKNLDNWTVGNYNQSSLLSYEIVLPRKYSLEDAHKFMIQDLDRFFEIKSRIEKRHVECLVLFRNSNNDKMESKSKIKHVECSADQVDATFENVPMRVFLNHLNQLLDTVVVLDETGYLGNIDMSFHLPENYKLDDIRRELKKYDLDLRAANRNIEMLVLSDK